MLAALGTPKQAALRCRIVTAAADGQSDAAIADELKVSRKTVRLWRSDSRPRASRRCGRSRLAGAVKPPYDSERVKAVIDSTLQSKAKGSTHRTCRLMAAHQGLSKSTVSNLWRSHNIKPHRTKTFNLSRDPRFLEKLTDVVGLYLNPPDQAIVLCVDAKTPN